MTDKQKIETVTASVVRWCKDFCRAPQDRHMGWYARSVPLVRLPFVLASMQNRTMTDHQKIKAAIKIATQYGGVDEAHHKAWVIDQMLRVLAGGGYADLICEICDGKDGPTTYSWDKGIAP